MPYGTTLGEPLDEPPTPLEKAASEGPLGNEAAWLLRIGETRAFPILGRKPFRVLSVAWGPASRRRVARTV